MSDAAQDFLESGGQTPHPLAAANDSNIGDAAQAYLDSGGSSDHPLKRSLMDRVQSHLDKLNEEGLAATATGGIAALGGGLTYLGTLAATGGDDDAAQDVKRQTQEALTYKPRTKAGQTSADDLSEAFSYLGEKPGKAAGGYVTDMATRAGASPQVAGGLGSAAETVTNIPQFVLPGVAGKLGRDVRAPVTLDAQGRVISDGAPISKSRAVQNTNSNGQQAPVDINDPKSAQELGIKPEKQEAQQPTGNLSEDQQAARKALAARVGLKEVRTSAITGDAQAAADDFDSTKYTNTPMGDRMRQVISSERQALVDHASGIIDDLGAREGTDQSTLIAKGKTMAKPLDMLADHIDDATSKAYADAQDKAGPAPVQFPKLEAALKDRTLTNSLLAQGKEGFLKGAQSQWDDFKETNPDGTNATQAEQYRQFLNTLWKANPDAVGKLKGAMDDDMHDHFGDDVFGDARQLHQLGKKLLDNPKGVSQISGKDPQTPANRTTAYEDIPNKVANLSGEQFKNLINTYKMMPAEIQPQAQAALSEIRGHLVNRLLDAGAKSDLQWNKKSVNTELSNNSENFKTAFADNPEAAAKIKDLKDAGEMLRFNSGYRGAHAQTSNMIKQGVGAGAEWAGAGAGGALGTFMGGPGIPTAAGAMAGKAAVAKGLSSLRDRSIRKDVESRIVKLDQ